MKDKIFGCYFYNEDSCLDFCDYAVGTARLHFCPWDESETFTCIYPDSVVDPLTGYSDFEKSVFTVTNVQCSRDNNVIPDHCPAL